MIPRFKKSRFEPKPIETDYWIDLNENEYGGVFKYYDNNAMVWKQTEAITKEREPQFTNSPAYKITTNDINYWNNKVDYEDFDVLKEEVLDLGSKYEGVTLTTLEYYMDILNKNLENKADKSDTYTKKQIDEKLTNTNVQLPENVSYFKNDVGYVTEANLEEKLPDNIVSDENYVHTDNNFNNEYKSKLDGLTDDLKAIEYDDTEVKRLINQNTERINSLQKSVEQDIAATVESMSEEIAKKANADEVYTKTYLDEVFTQFVRKTHKSYGFIDERPTTDLGTSDTGFIFYDYTVNEALLWVADEWRLLRTNEALTNFIKEEDITRAVTDWEWNQIGDTDFCNLTKYIGEYTDTMDLTVPNIYIDMFNIKLGNSYSNIVGEELMYELPSSVTSTFTDGLGRTYKKISYIPLDVPEKRMGYRVTNLLDTPGYDTLEVTDVFGSVVAKPRTAGGTAEYVVSYCTVEGVSTATPINSLTIAQGVKEIGDYMFCNVTASNMRMDIPSGVERIGEGAFTCSSVTDVTFPRNPVRLGAIAFRKCPLKSVTFPRTLDWDYIKNGGSGYCFAESTSPVDIVLEEGVKAVPSYAFYNSIISSLDFPDSLEWIGFAAFYNGHAVSDRVGKLTFKSKNLKLVQSWAFRNVNFKSIDLTNVETVHPYAFYYYKDNQANPCTSLILGPTLKNMYQASYPSDMWNCAVSIVLPGTMKSLHPHMVYKHGRSVANAGVDIEVVISEGIESLGYASIYYTGFNTTVTLPESLKYIGCYALGGNLYLKNESLYIPKNVRIIGGTASQQGGDWFYEMTEDEELMKKIWPTSPNGYGPGMLKEYIEDGGTLPEYGHGNFYRFAQDTMKEYIVDEENQWFKSVDGVLFSKDGKRLIAYPCARGTETYEIPEGCEYGDAAAFAFSGLYDEAEWEDEEGNVTTISVIKDGTFPTEAKGHVLLKTLILPNTFVNYSPYEIMEKWPAASQGHFGNVLSMMCSWYTAIERILVKDDHPLYKNEGDLLLSKDGTTLQVITMGMKGTYRLPDTVTTIAPGAFAAMSYNNGYGINTDYLGANVTPTAAHANDIYVKWFRGLKLIIPPSVVNISDLTLFQLNVANKDAYISITFEEGNPAFTYNSTTGNYERV